MSTNTQGHPSDHGRGDEARPERADRAYQPSNPDDEPSHSELEREREQDARERFLVHPATGEMLELAEAATTELADWRLELVELKHRLDALASDLDVELAARLDYEGTRSARVGAFDVSVQAPTIVEYDVPRLGIALEALVDDGRISRAVGERAIKVEVKRSAVQRELSALLRHADSEVRAAVERVRSENPRARRLVTVRRARD